MDGYDAARSANTCTKLQELLRLKTEELATAERRLAELQDAVRWERECADFWESRCGPRVDAWEHYSAAQDAVDALIGGEG